MNSQYVKKNAIALKLAELFAGTCKYSPDTMARWDKIEPHELNEFRNALSFLADQHFNDRLIKKDIEDCMEYVENVGRNYGHVTSSYTTGTWGVRYSELKNMLKVLEIPNFEMIKEGQNFTYYNVEYILKSGFRVESNFLVITVQSVQYPNSDSFESCFGYSHIDIFTA